MSGKHLLAAAAVAVLLGAIPGGVASAKPARKGASTHKAAASRTTTRTNTSTRTATRTGNAVPLSPSSSSSSSSSPSSSSPSDTGTTATTTGKTIKTKTYTFGAMDVEGKLKTPQLLYFLDRVKLELDMSAPDKRSFMKELAQSADDRNL